MQFSCRQRTCSCLSACTYYIHSPCKLTKLTFWWAEWIIHSQSVTIRLHRCRCLRAKLFLLCTLQTCRSASTCKLQHVYFQARHRVSYQLESIHKEIAYPEAVYILHEFLQNQRKRNLILL